jgi:hypothetical protein
MKRRFLVALIGLAAVAGLVACQTDSSSGGRAGVSVYLTDTPLDLTGVTAVNVTLSSVSLFPSDAGSGEEGEVELETGPIAMPGDLTLNLLDFRNGQVAFVGSQTVPAGAYSRIRLQIVSAELVQDDDGDPATPDLVTPITVPSGKVDVTVPFTLTAGENLAITMDFDAQASVQVNSTNGQHAYLLRPVINVAGLKAS